MFCTKKSFNSLYDILPQYSQTALATSVHSDRVN
jgi:hypothetical protein